MTSTQPKAHIPSIFQLLMSLAGLVSGLAAVVILVAMVLIRALFMPEDSFSLGQMLPLVWACLLFALLTLPSVVLAIRRLAHKTQLTPNSRYSLLLASLTLIPAVGLGFLGVRLASGQGSSVVLSLISMALILAPIWWFLEFGRSRLPVGSAQWQWGLVSFGINVTLPIIVLFELIIIAILLSVGGVWMARQPEFTPIWMQFQTQLMLDPQKMNLLVERILPLLQKPAVVMGGFMFVSLIVPLIEEIFKTSALWFFIKRGMTAADGFTAGLLCGAGFALVESTTSILAVPGEAWGFTIIGRVGTGLLHIFTAGLMGWALASAWQGGRYVRLGGVLLANVLIHGVWNFLAVTGALADRLPVTFDLFPPLPAWIPPAAMVALFVLLFGGLWIMNRFLRHQHIPPEIPSLAGHSVE